MRRSKSTEPFALRTVPPSCLPALSHGAKPEFGVPLHSPVHRKPNPAAAKVMDEDYIKKLWREGPDLQYPFLSNRLAKEQHLVSLGEDTNRVATIYCLMGIWTAMPSVEHDSTALAHAKDSMDWDFVGWLLENGADPAANDKARFTLNGCYILTGPVMKKSRISMKT
ncbi:hypothetical protein CSUB01_03208 [Colletotrichum sublineola]|uniref:Ankyrin repeat protein n=1 Tax=Colletotrichum sublineola TaxID=1173701 RepID=A0A066XCM2_COLSU|nr:hypothetical protein CSUB01_03208 [Colletotrichum sublineola]